MVDGRLSDEWAHTSNIMAMIEAAHSGKKNSKVDSSKYNPTLAANKPQKTRGKVADLAALFGVEHSGKVPRSTK